MVREPWYWPAALSREEAEMTAPEMRRHGVDVREGTELATVTRDASGRVSGVTTTTGESIACELLGVCVGVEPQVEWLKGVATPPAPGRGVMMDATLRTMLDDVWAAGDCAEHGGRKVESIWYSAKRQGTLADVEEGAESLYAAHPTRPSRGASCTRATGCWASTRWDRAGTTPCSPAGSRRSARWTGCARTCGGRSSTSNWDARR